ncbi:MAG: 5'-3' exonuclease H3TH domain-containing protein [Planctomycetota bacterium]|nr:5'-3' exonuclease H3TH domain-containing protein [Planctomycetota bacterium]
MDCYILDGTALLFRSFFSIGHVETRDGTPANGVFGALQSLIKFLDSQMPRHVAIAFDVAPTTFRNEIFPEYKANRGDPPDELIPQFDLMREMADALRFPSYGIQGYEADDIMVTLALRMKEAGYRVLMSTGDKDIAQVVDDEILLFDMKTEEIQGPAEVEEKMGVKPSQILELLALRGDSVDNIPGVKGIGGKTALTILQAGLTVQEIAADPSLLDSVDLRGKATVIRKLQEGRADYELSKELARTRTDVPLEVKDNLSYGGPDESSFQFVQRLGFHALAARLKAIVARYGADDA